MNIYNMNMNCILINNQILCAQAVSIKCPKLKKLNKMSFWVSTFNSTGLMLIPSLHVMMSINRDLWYSLNWHPMPTLFPNLHSWQESSIKKEPAQHKTNVIRRRQNGGHLLLCSPRSPIHIFIRLVWLTVPHNTYCKPHNSWALGRESQTLKAYTKQIPHNVSWYCMMLWFNIWKRPCDANVLWSRFNDLTGFVLYHEFRSDLD